MRLRRLESKVCKNRPLIFDCLGSVKTSLLEGKTLILSTIFIIFMTENSPFSTLSKLITGSHQYLEPHIPNKSLVNI